MFLLDALFHVFTWFYYLLHFIIQTSQRICLHSMTCSDSIDYSNNNFVINSNSSLCHKINLPLVF